MYTYIRAQVTSGLTARRWAGQHGT